MYSAKNDDGCVPAFPFSLYMYALTGASFPGQYIYVCIYVYVYVCMYVCTTRCRRYSYLSSSIFFLLHVMIRVAIYRTAPSIQFCLLCASRPWPFRMDRYNFSMPRRRAAVLRRVFYPWCASHIRAAVGPTCRPNECTTRDSCRMPC